MNAVSFYNTTVAAGKMAAAASCIAATGPVGLVPIAASLAVFQGVELFAEAVSKYGADKLAARAAGRDQRKYESYLKTCQHFTDFVATLGVQSVAPKAVCKAEKQISAANKYGKKVDYPTSINTSLKHKALLTFQQAGILTKDGRLTKQAIRESTKIPLREPIKNQLIIATLTKDGSSISDWAKFATKKVQCSDGKARQVHFYMNLKTGKIDYDTIDYKVNLPV